MADGLTSTQAYRERQPAAELGRHVACVFVQEVFPFHAEGPVAAEGEWWWRRHDEYEEDSR